MSIQRHVVKNFVCDICGTEKECDEIPEYWSNFFSIPALAKESVIDIKEVEELQEAKSMHLCQTCASWTVRVLEITGIHYEVDRCDSLNHVPGRIFVG